MSSSEATSAPVIKEDIPAAEPGAGSADPFASQRESGNNPFSSGENKGSSEPFSTEDPKDVDGPVEDGPVGQGLGEGGKVRRTSNEWDASKVPPSQFQKRKGSVYATPSSRDSHTSGERDKAYFEKLKEKGWNVLKKK